MPVEKNPRLRRWNAKSHFLKVVREKNDFFNWFNKSTRRANHFGLSEFVSSPSRKNISVFRKRKTGYINSHPVPLRGALRNGHQRGAGMRWTRMALLTRVPEVDE